jgi:hypothetical protein
VGTAELIRKGGDVSLHLGVVDREDFDLRMGREL